MPEPFLGRGRDWGSEVALIEGLGVDVATVEVFSAVGRDWVLGEEGVEDILTKGDKKCVGGEVRAASSGNQISETMGRNLGNFGETDGL